MLTKLIALFESRNPTSFIKMFKVPIHHIRKSAIIKNFTSLNFLR